MCPGQPRAIPALSKTKTKTVPHSPSPPLPPFPPPLPVRDPAQRFSARFSGEQFASALGRKIPAAFIHEHFLWPFSSWTPPPPPAITPTPSLFGWALCSHPRSLQSFWISYTDFLLYFASVGICRRFPKQNAVVVEGIWHGQTAGGPYFEIDWCYNPRYEVRLEGSGALFAHLALPDVRFRPPPLDTIGYCAALLFHCLVVLCHNDCAGVCCAAWPCAVQRCELL